MTMEFTRVKTIRGMRNILIKETRDSQMVVPSLVRKMSLANRFFGGCIEDMDGVHVECDRGFLADAQLRARVDA